MLADGREVRAALLAERLSDLGRGLERGEHALVLHVEDPQRARGALLASLVVEHLRMGVEPLVQALEVGRPAAPVADRVEPQLPLRDAEAPKQLVVELDHLGVDGRVLGADRLDRELPVLAEPPALGSRVPVHRRDREELLRLRLAVEPVLEVRADDRRRPLGPQRQRPAAPVGERIHLLLDDVRAGPGRSLEELRVLEPGRLDPAVAVERAETLGLPRHPLPQRRFGGEDVVGSPRRLDWRHEARSSARNGLRASSAPSVVRGPWPG